jgi:hypothetical protein
MKATVWSGIIFSGAWLGQAVGFGKLGAVVGALAAGALTVAVRRLRRWRRPARHQSAEFTAPASPGSPASRPVV